MYFFPAWINVGVRADCENQDESYFLSSMAKPQS